jgi:hypothetical protein
VRGTEHCRRPDICFESWHITKLKLCDVLGYHAWAIVSHPMRSCTSMLDGMLTATFFGVDAWAELRLGRPHPHPPPMIGQLLLQQAPPAEPCTPGWTSLGPVASGRRPQPASRETLETDKGGRNWNCSRSCHQLVDAAERQQIAGSHNERHLGNSKAMTTRKDTRDHPTQGPCPGRRLRGGLVPEFGSGKCQCSSIGTCRRCLDPSLLRRFLSSV